MVVKMASKILKYIYRTLLIVFIILIIFLLGSFINHKIKTYIERKYLENYDLGKIIEINNLKVNYKIFK